MMKLYCSGMQKPHRKKRFLFVRRTTPRSGGTLRAAFYSACTFILHASHGNVNVHFAQIRPAFRSAVCGTRVRAAGLSAEKTRAGAGKRARRARFSLRQGRGAESLSAHRQRGGRIAYLWYAVDSTAFSRAPSNRPCFFRVPARRNRVSSAYRRTERAFRALSDRLRFSHTPSDGRTGKTPRGRTLLRRDAFFAGSDLLRLFAEQPSDQRAQQARRTEAVNFQKNQPLPFYVISKRT